MVRRASNNFVQTVYADSQHQLQLVSLQQRFDYHHVGKQTNVSNQYKTVIVIKENDKNGFHRSWIPTRSSLFFP